MHTTALITKTALICSTLFMHLANVLLEDNGPIVEQASVTIEEDSGDKITPENKELDANEQSIETPMQSNDDEQTANPELSAATIVEAQTDAQAKPEETEDMSAAAETNELEKDEEVDQPPQLVPSNFVSETDNIIDQSNETALELDGQQGGDTQILTPDQQEQDGNIKTEGKIDQDLFSHSKVAPCICLPSMMVRCCMLIHSSIYSMTC